MYVQAPEDEQLEGFGDKLVILAVLFIAMLLLLGAILVFAWNSGLFSILSTNGSPMP